MRVTAGRRRVADVGAGLTLVILVVGGFVLLRRDDSEVRVTDVPATLEAVPTSSVLLPDQGVPSTLKTVLTTPQSVPSTLATAPTTDEAVPVDTRPFTIIASRPAGRDLEIIEITDKGGERLLRTLSADVLKPGVLFDSGGIAVSSTGWFSAFSTGFELVLVDLRDPASTPRVIDCRCISGRWNATGDRYAVVGEQGTFVIDPSSGEMVEVPGYYPVDGTPEPIWSADGTALLSTSESSRTGLGEWSMIPIDGGPSRPGSAPLYWQRGTRYVDDSGRWIQSPHSGAAGGMLTVDSDASAPEIWYDAELQAAQLRDFSFTSKGNAIWMLLSTVATDHAGLELVRSTAPGEYTVVIPFVPFDAVSGADFDGISAIAPDDSVLVASASRSDGWDEIVVETDGGATFPLPADTHVSGFVPSALADTLGTAAANPVPTITTPIVDGFAGFAPAAVVAQIPAGTGAP